LIPFFENAEKQGESMLLFFRTLTEGDEAVVIVLTEIELEGRLPTTC